MAVTFFFVLGGFAMTLGYKDKVMMAGFSYGQYLSRRCIKFYPLHWLCIFAIMPLAFLSFSWMDIPKLFLNAVLLQTWIPIKEVYFSFNAVSWYLADTMFFAIVFPLIFKRISSASSKGRVVLATALAVVYVIVGILIPEDKYHAVMYISPYMRLMDFVLGIYLALGYMKLRERPVRNRNRVISQIVVALLIVFLVVESCLLSETATLFAPVYWIPVALLILIASLSERMGGGKWLLNRWLQCVGEMSFIIFMVHQIILRYTTVVFDKILHLENEIFYVVFTLAMTVIVSIVVDKYILKPITQWLTKRIQPSMIVRS